MLDVDVVIVVVYIDASSSGINQRKEAWESQRKAYTAEFFEVDPCMVSLSLLFKISGQCS